MLTRYIRKDEKLYYAMVVDGKYRLPMTVNKTLMQPQYIILSEKKGLLEVMYYNFYQVIQAPGYLSPAQSKQMFIPLSHIVKPGDAAVRPKEEIIDSEI